MTVQQSILKQLSRARAAGTPICMIDTEEFETARDVAYDPLSPVTPAHKDDGLWQLLGEGDVYAADNVLDELPKEFPDAPHTYLIHLRQKDDVQHRQLDAFARRYRMGKLRHSMILLYGRAEHLPDTLHSEVHIIPAPYPDQPEIRELLREALSEHALDMPKDAQRRLALSLRGFTVPKIKAMLRLMRLPEDGAYPIFNAEQYNRIIREEKQQVLLRNGDLLQLIDVEKRSAEDEQKPQLGGLGRIRTMAKGLGKRINSAEDFVRRLGVTLPKGMLMAGVAGGGKSGAAKLLAASIQLDDGSNIPLLRMDMGRLMGGYLGDSERQLRRALDLVGKMAPAILFIDEIEKGLSGMGSNDAKNGGSGTAGRMFSTLLTWMQEHTEPVFICATCNSLRDMTDELMRKGRMDQLFSVFMPTHAECVEIFCACMRTQERAALKKRREAGIEDKTPVFSEECYAVLDQIVGDMPGKAALGISLARPGEGRAPLFVTGSDIAYIVSEASVRCLDRTPITDTEWVSALRDVIGQADLTTTGSGESSLAELALGCIRTMRGKFVPAADDKYVLFRPEDYKIIYADSESDNPARVQDVQFTQQCASDCEYDQLLFQAVKRHISALAVPYEQQQLAQQIGKR